MTRAHEAQVAGGLPGQVATMGEANSVVPDATAIAAMIRRREISALEAVDDAIARARAMQPQLNFLVAPTFERARARARSGRLRGRFAGVPYLVKDMYDIRGVPTRWGSRFTAGAPLPLRSCAQVAAFEAVGLVIIGKSALGEFGWLPSTESLAFGPTRSPWDLARSPGGSSGGSAAAVAAGVVPMADAADGGGSIRIPASACGLFGLKPSRRRLVGDQSAAGGIELTAEHCLSRSVRDSAGLFAAMERSGADAVHPRIGFVSQASNRRLRVGFALDSIGGRRPTADVRAGVVETVALLERLGHEVEATVWPVDGAALVADFRKLYCAAALGVLDVARLVVNPRSVAVASLALKALGFPRSGLGRLPDDRDLEPLTFAMAEEARALPAGELERAIARLQTYEAAYANWFGSYDVILSPVLLSPPVLVGEIAGDVEREVLMQRVFDFADYTLIHNIVGAPAMSVPLHRTPAGLPIGMQFAARVGDERTLFELAYELETARPWAHLRPPVFAGDATPAGTAPAVSG